MRTVNGLVLAIVIAFGVPAVVDAQAQPPDTRQAPIERRDDRGNWGWLGLLGLPAFSALLGGSDTLTLSLEFRGVRVRAANGS